MPRFESSCAREFFFYFFWVTFLVLFRLVLFGRSARALIWVERERGKEESSPSSFLRFEQVFLFRCVTHSLSVFPRSVHSLEEKTISSRQLL